MEVFHHSQECKITSEEKQIIKKVMGLIGLAVMGQNIVLNMELKPNGSYQEYRIEWMGTTRPGKKL